MSDQSLSMDGTNPESAITSEEQAARSARDRQRLHAVGFQHLQFVVGGLLIWGASGYWFATSPGLLITILSLAGGYVVCLLYTSPSPRDGLLSRMPSSA